MGPCRRGEKVGNKWNNKSSETIFWAAPNPVSLVWLVVESNTCCYVSLGHSTISEQCRLNLRGHSEDYSISTISSWVFTIPCSLGPDFFVLFSLHLIFFSPFIMLVGWMVNVHSIRFLFDVIIRAKIPILDISVNPIFLFFDSLVFNTVK